MKYCVRALLILLVISVVTACKQKKDITKNTSKQIDTEIYRASVTRINDLVHTFLDLEPDFTKKELKGEIILVLQPHFYATDSLILNAKYMRIESVHMIESGKSKDSFYGTDAYGYEWTNGQGYAYMKIADQHKVPLDYNNDSLCLKIKLNRVYTKGEKYSIIIKYVAQPEKVKAKGSAAISDAKGIYFINTDEKIPEKPVQIWTQGETESASCWFPTIDVPNQKTTQQLRVKVPEKYKTISNGLLVKSEKLFQNNMGNMRRDLWVQELPHAPYLFALVIGDFAEVKDKWKGKDVNYYVEPAFEPYARLVFGNTPKMLEYFSNLLQVPYPWDKYHQVVVRDFVSGAMENTGCVVHYDKLQHNHREHLDNTHEDIIAHELFHHWFGDLVTCESWSNLPLNESFASYGEYLWYEYQYGRDEADVKLNHFHSSYFDESAYKSENLIRYHYDEKEDMFDAHSYQKGGSILHMLRKYTGDEAFFASLKLYLNSRAYKTAELDDLRLAFEEVTGEDLNWFFNQWMLDKGHPNLNVFHQTYNGSGEIYGITVVQHGKLYKLPVDVDIYTEKGIERHRIMIEKDSQTFGIVCKNKPLCVIFDAENQILAEIRETKTIEGWESQFRYATLSGHKIMALRQLLNFQQDRKRNSQYCKAILKDSFWHNRSTALEELYKLGITEIEDNSMILGTIKEISLNDPKSAVRKQTVDFFRDLRDKEQLTKMLNDSSYEVARKSLLALMGLDKSAAYAFADLHRGGKANGLQEAVFIVIGRSSPKDELNFFMTQIEHGTKQTARNSAGGLSYYLTYNHPEHSEQVVNLLHNLAENKTTPGSSENALIAMNTLKNFYDYQLYYFKIFSKDKNKKSRKLYKEKMDATQKVHDQLESILSKYN